MNLGITSLKVVALAVFVFLQSGCPFHKNEMRPIGPEVKASLVIYFKPGITNQQVEDFWHEVLSKPDPQGRGYYHRAGVGDISRIKSVQGHEGVSMSFSPNATDEERKEVERDIRSSPIVYKVLENVAPADVKKID
jgi:hypothetical protein